MKLRPSVGGIVLKCFIAIALDDYTLLSANDVVVAHLTEIFLCNVSCPVILLFPLRSPITDCRLSGVTDGATEAKP